MAYEILSSRFIHLQLIGVRVLAVCMPTRRTFSYDIRDRHSSLNVRFQPYFLPDISQVGRFDNMLIAITGVWSP